MGGHVVVVKHPNFPLERTLLHSYTGQASQSLEHIAIFAGLPLEKLVQIQERCSWRRFEPGEPIVDYLDSTNEVFFISAGEARVCIYSV